MASAQHWIHDVADELRDEAEQLAEAVATEMAPPPESHDGRLVSRREYVAHVREMSQQDPTYVATLLETMAPAAVSMPDGQPLRPPTGVKNFLALMHEARPDLYALVTLEQTPPRRR